MFVFYISDVFVGGFGGIFAFGIMFIFLFDPMCAGIYVCVCHCLPRFERKGNI